MKSDRPSGLNRQAPPSQGSRATSAAVAASKTTTTPPLSNATQRPSGLTLFDPRPVNEPRTGVLRVDDPPAGVRLHPVPQPHRLGDDAAVAAGGDGPVAGVEGKRFGRADHEPVP